MWNSKNRGSPNATISSMGSANTLKNDRMILRSIFIGIAVNGKPLINRIKATHAKNITTHPNCHSLPLEQKQSLVLTLMTREIVRIAMLMSI